MKPNIKLEDIMIFNRLPSDALNTIKAALRSRQLSAGEILFNKGDSGDELIIVEEGRIEIFDPLEGVTEQEKPIRIFTPGETLGEMAIIDRMPRSLSARAIETSKILTLSGKTFQQLIHENPEMLNSVMSSLSDRIRYTTDFLSIVQEWVKGISKGNYLTYEYTSGGKSPDPKIAELAVEFAKMAEDVHSREERLRQQVAQLRIEIDEANRKQQVNNIIESDYYRSLKEKIKDMRQDQDE